MRSILEWHDLGTTFKEASLDDKIVLIERQEIGKCQRMLALTAKLHSVSDVVVTWSSRGNEKVSDSPNFSKQAESTQLSI